MLPIWPDIPTLVRLLQERPPEIVEILGPRRAQHGFDQNDGREGERRLEILEDRPAGFVHDESTRMG